MEGKQPPSYDEIQGASGYPPVTQQPQTSGYPHTAYPQPTYPPQQGQPPPGSVAYVVTPANASQTVIIAQAACPACRQGVISNDFTICGICLGIWFFPCGLICCFLMRDKRCLSCGARF